MRCSNFIRSDPDVDNQFKKFYDMQISDATIKSKLEMGIEDPRVRGILWKDWRS